MLDFAFSFRGRINRLQYFFGGLGLGVVMVVAILFCVALFGVGSLAGGMTKLTLALPIFAGSGLFLWVSLAMQTRRVRDIGWDPLYVVPPWFLLNLIDVSLTLAAGKSGSTLATLGGLINLALGCCLLFWPSRGDDFTAAATAVDDGWPEPDPAPAMPAAAPMALAGAAASVRAPSAMGSAPPRPSFGRRGLQT